MIIDKEGSLSYLSSTNMSRSNHSRKVHYPEDLELLIQINRQLSIRSPPKASISYKADLDAAIKITELKTLFRVQEIGVSLTTLLLNSS